MNEAKPKSFIVNSKDLFNEKLNPNLSLSPKDVLNNKKIPKKQIVKPKPKYEDNIPKDDLLGKYVDYSDVDRGRRCGKVIKINGLTLTVLTPTNTKGTCIHPETTMIYGAFTRKKGKFLPIDWGRPIKYIGKAKKDAQKRKKTR